MDFSIWFILESKIGAKKYPTVASLKRALKAAWADLDPELIRKCCADSRRRFEAVVEADGGYFEWSIFFYVLKIFVMNF